MMYNHSLLHRWVLSTVLLLLTFHTSAQSDYGDVEHKAGATFVKRWLLPGGDDLYYGLDGGFDYIKSHAFGLRYYYKLEQNYFFGVALNHERHLGRGIWYVMVPVGDPYLSYREETVYFDHIQALMLFQYVFPTGKVRPYVEAAGGPNFQYRKVFHTDYHYSNGVIYERSVKWEKDNSSFVYGGIGMEWDVLEDWGISLFASYNYGNFGDNNRLNGLHRRELGVQFGVYRLFRAKA